jgi:hypothetical protein
MVCMEKEEGEGEEGQAGTEGRAVEMRGFDDAVDIHIRERDSV